MHLNKMPKFPPSPQALFVALATMTWLANLLYSVPLASCSRPGRRVSTRLFRGIADKFLSVKKNKVGDKSTEEMNTRLPEAAAAANREDAVPIQRVTPGREENENADSAVVVQSIFRGYAVRMKWNRYSYFWHILRGWLKGVRCREAFLATF